MWFRVAAVLAAVALPAMAHHGADDAAIYEGSQPVDLSGTIAEVNWVNPHVFVHLDVVSASGATTRWLIELTSPGALLRQGWPREALQPGVQVRFTATPANDGRAIAYARRGTLADGRQLNDQSRFVPHL
jgi:Family of unknown function (DUF6152)